MDCETSGKDGEVKVDAGERCEAERDAEDVQSCHPGVYDPVRKLKEVQALQGGARFNVETFVTLLTSFNNLRHARYPSDSRETRFRP